MSAHRLIRYRFGRTSIVPFDAYGRSLLRHRPLIRRVPRQRNDARPAVSITARTLQVTQGNTDGSFRVTRLYA